MVSARAVFADAVKAVTVLAGVNLLFGWSGDEQADEIDKFLAKKGESIPQTLKAELAKVRGQTARKTAKEPIAGTSGSAGALVAKKE